MSRRQHRQLTATHTIQALVDVTMASFPDSICDSLAEQLTHSIESYLRKEITYDELADIFTRTLGVTSPAEQLRAIVEISDTPLPAPPPEIPSTGHRRHSRTWSTYEDQRLLAGIFKFGIENWTAISQFVGNARTRSQCSQRWYRGLNPSISKDNWTPEEEDRLLHWVLTSGTKSWTTIASKLGGRSDVQCRYRYQHLMKEKAVQHAEERHEVNWTRPPPSMVLPPLAMMNGPVHYARPIMPIPVGFTMGYIEQGPIEQPPPFVDDRAAISFQCQMPPVRPHLSPISGQREFQQSPLLPLPLPPVTSPFLFAQSPRLFTGPKPQQMDVVLGETHHEQPVVDHPITAPAFDGSIYSVY
jgi:hypothetical protein